MKSKVAKTVLKDLPVFKWLENLILFIVLSVIVLRVTFIESPHVNHPQSQMLLTSELVSLIISTVLLACFGLWLLGSVIGNRLRWRKTGFGAAVGLFLLAGIIAFFAASNKRAALTDLVVLITPMLSGLLLVQLLNSPDKIRLALLVIISVGIAASVQCYDQSVASNETLITDYEQNPQKHLGGLGIEADSLEHWLYEHRLYSKGIRGFLMTSNSAASFFLLAIFAAIGLILQGCRKIKCAETWAALVCYLLALCILLFGLGLTQSKGGIGAFIVALFFLMILSVMGKSLWKHRIFIVGILVILVAAGLWAIIAYGMSHQRLPGGNSMLVRWQYWQSTVEMIKDHPLAGVGGANFSEYYTHYKIPAASETVRDPHNWLLSLLSQYGPLGIVAILAAVIWPVIQSLGYIFSEGERKDVTLAPVSAKFWIGLLFFTGFGWLFVRPFLVGSELFNQSGGVMAAAYLVLFLVPAGVFIGAFILLRIVSIGETSVFAKNGLLMMSLVCGLGAVLVHNLIDFAIFEPGIWSILWLLVAILAAEIQNHSDRFGTTVEMTAAKRITTLAGAAFVAVFYLIFVLGAPLKANINHRTIGQVMSEDELVVMFDRAVEADKLSPDAAYQAAGYLTQYFKQTRMLQNTEMLQQALEFAQIAQQRNPAAFKPWRLQSEINLLLSEQADSGQRQFYLQQTYDNLKQAAARYPGSGKMHYAMATIAEELELLPEALGHYQTAVWIEDLYREQFQIMYPEQGRVISRLGNLNYEIALEKIELLLEQMEEESDETVKPI